MPKRMTSRFPDELSRDQVDWFGREHDNLRAALDWSREQEAELELRLVVACYGFWKRSGNWTEGRQREEAALERGGEAPALLRARALRQLADVVVRQGDFVRGRELMEAAVVLHQELGKGGLEALHAHIMLAICEHKLGNSERALELYDAVRASGDERVLSTTLNNLGNMALEEHDHTRARAHFEESAAINRRLKQEVGLANNLLDLGFVALADARAEDAARAFRESLGICRAERLEDLLVWVVEGVAAVAVDGGAPIIAATLLGATTRSRAELALAADFYPIAEEMRERTLDAARGKLGEAEFAAAWAEGEALSLEEAAEKAALELKPEA